MGMNKNTQGKAESGLGLVAGDITDEAVQQYGLASNQGVVIFDVIEGSAADTAGVMKGDVLHEMNGAQIKDKDDFEAAAGKVKQGGQVVLLIERGNTMLYTAFINN
jgi:serine protease Do